MGNFEKRPDIFSIKQFFTTLFLSLGIIVWAQVPKKVVVEHFTNTRCSICASKNPGFYTNLNNHPEVLHLAVHPSSPYANCLLNNHNTSENDGRTNYYGLYGSTPKFVIQGEVVSGSTNINNATLFAPYLGQMSPASISMTMEKFGSDSLTCQVVVKTEQSHSLGNLRLFVALTEDIISYAAPNGENLHYDVFRKALTSVNGDLLTLPAAVGDSVVFKFNAPAHMDWNFNRIYALAVLQEEGNKKVVQSSATTKTGNPLSVETQTFEKIKLYPNPTTGQIQIEGNIPGRSQINLYNVKGELVRTVITSNLKLQKMDLTDLEKGLYVVQIQNGKEQWQQRILLE